MEKVRSALFTTNIMTNSNYYLCIPNSWFILFNKLISNEVSLSGSSLVDISGIDSSKYNVNIFKKVFFKFYKNILTYFMYFLPTLKIRLILFFPIKNSISSVDYWFKNAN